MSGRLSTAHTTGSFRHSSAKEIYRAGGFPPIDRPRYDLLPSMGTHGGRLNEHPSRFSDYTSRLPPTSALLDEEEGEWTVFQSA